MNCNNCGKKLRGMQKRWCGSPCGDEYYKKIRTNKDTQNMRKRMLEYYYKQVRDKKLSIDRAIELIKGL